MRDVASRSIEVTCTATSGTQNQLRNPCTAITPRLRATGARYAVRIAIPVSSDAASTKNAASAAARAAYQRIRSAFTSDRERRLVEDECVACGAARTEPLGSGRRAPQAGAFGKHLRLKRADGDH